jgi:pyrroloquinoline-quinone synthase
MTGQDFLERIDGIINERHLLSHPFYQMWNRGELTLETLREYAKEYYHQVRFFPTYVSAIHSNCDDMEVRQMLLENLVEEEQGPDNHPELWLRFGEALGLERDEMLNHKYLRQTRASVTLLRELAKRDNPAEGLASLYAYESQFPAVSETKVEGLKKHYGIDSENGTIFFDVHMEADIIHSQVARDALERLCKTDAEKEAALDATREAADAFNLLLDGVYENYCTNNYDLSKN